MRIESGMKVLGDLPRKGIAEGKAADAFASVMKNSQSKLQLNLLNQLMERIDLQGQRLSRHRTLENLINYKKLVKQFVNDTLSYGLQLSDKQSFHPNGGMKTHQLIEVIDQKLLAINNKVLDDEKEGLDTLRLVGEIKGMLINLYR